MQSLLIACLTFAHIPEDSMPAVSGTSPSNGSSELSATFQLALIRLTLLSFTLAFHQPASVRPLGEPNATLTPTTGSPVSPRQRHRECGSLWALPVAWWSQGGWTRQPGTALVQAGQGCKDVLAPQDTRPFFHSYQERSPVLKQSIHPGFCCPLVRPESSSSP